LATAALDLTQTLPAKLRALGITSEALAAAYAGLPETSYRRMMSGAPGFAERLESFEKTVSELEKFKQVCWPLPLDFRAVGFIKFSKQRIEHGLTVIYNADSEGRVTADATAGLDTLAGIGSKESREEKIK
jgi:hypothetical protein